jgi:hypothetical protein
VLPLATSSAFSALNSAASWPSSPDVGQRLGACPVPAHAEQHRPEAAGKKAAGAACQAPAPTDSTVTARRFLA